MQRYANRSGNSGVEAYRVTADAILVKFVGRDALYEYRGSGRAGAANVARMKALARAGRGLASFISRHAHDLYER